MAVTAFEGLRPAPDTHHAEWIVASLHEPPGVGFRVPAGFEAILRIHHPLEGGLRWADVAPRFWGTREEQDWPSEAADALPGRMGELEPAIVDRLVPLLAAATATPDACHYGRWVGWGDLHPSQVSIAYMTPAGWRWWRKLARRRALARARRLNEEVRRPVRDFAARCPIEPWWGGRDMLLFDGPVAAVASIGMPYVVSSLGDQRGFNRHSPQWWWPDDRAWFVATEIDDVWSYLAGPPALIEAVRGLGLEAVLVRREHPW